MNKIQENSCIYFHGQIIQVVTHSQTMFLLLTNLVPIEPFSFKFSLLIPLKKSEKLLVFYFFQVDQNGTLRKNGDIREK